MSEPVSESAQRDDDSLVAYLDGELDDAETARIEQRLASEPALRTRLQDLQRTWDLLDSLPIVKTDDAFTQSTIELTVQQVTRDSARRRHWLRRLGPVLALGCLALVTALAARALP